jgi:hypothetical protein
MDEIVACVERLGFLVLLWEGDAQSKGFAVDLEGVVAVCFDGDGVNCGSWNVSVEVT